jgi:hypothetical protein
VLIEKGQELNGLFADPMFENPEEGDLQLKAASPCIDAGKIIDIPNLAWASAYEGFAPDIGAFENNKRLIGPSFISTNQNENPRISHWYLFKDSLYVAFSAAMNSETLEGNVGIELENGNVIYVSNWVKNKQHLYSTYWDLEEKIAGFKIRGEVLSEFGTPATNWGTFKKDFYPMDSVFQLLISESKGGSIHANSARKVFKNGDEVTLWAAPEDGYRFVKWEGDIDSSDDTITVAITKSRWIIPHFEKIEEVLSASSYKPQTHLFPNPTTGSVLLTDSSIEHVDVYTLSGSFVSRFYRSENQSFDLSQLTNGIYLIRNRDWIKRLLITD